MADKLMNLFNASASQLMESRRCWHTDH